LPNPLWGTDYWAFEITLDENVSSTIMGNLQMSADATLKSAVRNNIKIDGKSLETILTEKGNDYAVMIAFSNNIINLSSMKNQNILTKSSGHKIEILTGLVDITKAKNFKASTYFYDSSAGSWSNTINVSDVTDINVPWDGAWGFNINFSYAIDFAGEKINQQATDWSKSVAFRDMVRNNILIDGETLGSILTRTSNEYAVMVAYSGNSLKISSDQSVNILNPASDHKIEIKSGLLTYEEDASITPVIYFFDKNTGHWSKQWVNTVNISSVGAIHVPWSEAWGFDINMSNKIKYENLGDRGNQQSDSAKSTTLRDSVRNNILIDGETIGSILTRTENQYTVMVTYTNTSLRIFSGQSANILDPNKAHKIQILSNLLNYEEDAKITASTYYYDNVSKVWGTNRLQNSISSISSISEASSVWVFELTAMKELSKQVEMKTNLQADTNTNTELKNSICDNIIVDGKSIRQLIEQAGHQYPIMIAYSPTTIKFTSGLGNNLLNPEIDHTLTVNSGLITYEGIGTFAQETYHYSSLTKLWTTSVYVPVTFVNYKNAVKSYVTNISLQSKVSDFSNINNIVLGSGMTLVFKDINGNPITNVNTQIGTGVTVEAKYGDSVYNTYNILIYGDLTSDGDVTVEDLAAIKANLLKQNTLSEIKTDAADVSKDGKITISDLLAVKKQILGIATISQVTEINMKNGYTITNDEIIGLKTYSYRPFPDGIADFSLVYDGTKWHLLHILRESGKPRSPGFPGQEVWIGHAEGEKLTQLQKVASSFTIRNGKWDQEHVWAPGIVFNNEDRKWYMFYTGMIDGTLSQKIGVARSEDLVNWEYPVDEPVIDPVKLPWAEASNSNYTNCRDPYITNFDGKWHLYFTATTKDNKTCIGHAVSDDLLTWQDKGYVFSANFFNGNNTNTVWEQAESPCVFLKDGIYYLVFNLDKGLMYTSSDNPNDFSKIPPKPLYDLVFNFEILDVGSGLFSFATGNYYGSLYFGTSNISNGNITVDITRTW
jgi:hypothetical protein